MMIRVLDVVISALMAVCIMFALASVLIAVILVALLHDLAALIAGLLKRGKK